MSLWSCFCQLNSLNIFTVHSLRGSPRARQNYLFTSRVRVQKATPTRSATASPDEIVDLVFREAAKTGLIRGRFALRARRSPPRTA